MRHCRNSHLTKVYETIASLMRVTMAVSGLDS